MITEYNRIILIKQRQAELERKQNASNSARVPIENEAEKEAKKPKKTEAEKLSRKKKQG